MGLAGLLGRGFFASGGAGSLVITAVDDGDDTGATATIAGATGTVTVYGARWDGGFSATTWAVVGTRTGNGTVALTLAAGYWWLYAVDDNHISGTIGLEVTTGDEVIWYQLLIAVQTLIQALSLDGLLPAEIIVQKFPINAKTSPPPAGLTKGIFITPGRETLTFKTNLKDDYGYPVQVTYFAAANRNLTSNISRAMQWRDRIWKANIFQYVGGIESVYNCIPEPGPVFDAGAWSELFDAGSLVLRFLSREARGI